jgi:hypothetical protein
MGDATELKRCSGAFCRPLKLRRIRGKARANVALRLPLPSSTFNLN